MDTQNTPVHIKLWHREFWMMAFANLLLMMSAYMLIPALPPYLLQQGYSCLQVGCVMGAYDNMSGCAGLLGIMEQMKGKELNYGLRFVFCGSEERGLLGSKAYVRDHEAALLTA